MESNKLLIVRLTQRNIRVMTYLARLDEFAPPESPDQRVPRVFFSGTGYHANMHQVAGMKDILEGLYPDTEIYLPESDDDMERMTSKVTGIRLAQILAGSLSPRTDRGSYILGTTDNEPLLRLESHQQAGVVYARPANIFFTEIEEARQKHVTVENSDLYAIKNIFTTLVKLTPDEYQAIAKHHSKAASQACNHNPIISMYNVAIDIFTSARHRAVLSQQPDSADSWL